MPRKRKTKASTARRSHKPLRISVITPSFNSADAIERAIKSVLSQDYPHFEHIIMDGGSTDGTVEILKKYQHLKWISEPDQGQSDAMNKGFAKATGDIMAYLNADDYYLDGAFSAVIPKFEQGAKMVMGKVRVIQEGNQTDWINDPRTDLESMLRHWEPDAFCVNPVGYFYRREVQEQVPFNIDNPDKMDLEFLLGAAAYCKIEKVDHLMGVFDYDTECKTGKEQVKLDYWRPENFPEVNAALEKMPAAFQKRFEVARATGYQLRRKYQIDQITAEGRLGESLQRRELIPLPQDDGEVNASLVADTKLYACERDSVVVVLTHGKVASQSVWRSLQAVPAEVATIPVYHLHTISGEKVLQKLYTSRGTPGHQATAASLSHLFQTEGQRIRWKFIAGVRDPIAFTISNIFQNRSNCTDMSLEEIEQISKGTLAHSFSHFETEYKHALGVDCFATPFDKKKGYTIIEQDNVAVLIYSLETLNENFASAIHEFLGVADVSISRVNRTANSPVGDRYQDVTENAHFSRELLDLAYNSEYAKHFYSPSQIANFKAKWGGRK